jgi:hypothetical protein
VSAPISSYAFIGYALRWMTENGSAVTLDWDSGYRIWRCTWIADGETYLGSARSYLPDAAIEECLGNAKVKERFDRDYREEADR